MVKVPSNEVETDEAADWGEEEVYPDTAKKIDSRYAKKKNREASGPVRTAENGEGACRRSGSRRGRQQSWLTKIKQASRNKKRLEEKTKTQRMHLMKLYK